MMEKKFISAKYITPDQKQGRKQNNLGEIICCGNHVFRVINGKRHWISRPPNGYEGKNWLN